MCVANSSGLHFRMQHVTQRQPIHSVQRELSGTRGTHAGAGMAGHNEKAMED